MIKVNGEIVVPKKFPDGTIFIQHIVDTSTMSHSIEWLYENDEEMVLLMMLAMKIRDSAPYHDLSLYMPYLPHVRMDRAKNPEDVCTLKYFGNFINSLNFDKVTVRDVHSNAASWAINNLTDELPVEFIQEAMERVSSIERTNPLLYFPDSGAVSRYSSMAKVPYIFGTKFRDWASGEIKGTIVNGNVPSDQPILIVDDICSKGGTFYYAAKQLKEMGAGKIYLYVTHCENSITDGQLISSGLVERVFTTRTIFHYMPEVSLASDEYTDRKRALDRFVEFVGD